MIRLISTGLFVLGVPEALERIFFGFDARATANERRA